MNWTSLAKVSSFILIISMSQKNFKEQNGPTNDEDKSSSSDSCPDNWHSIILKNIISSNHKIFPFTFIPSNFLFMFISTLVTLSCFSQTWQPKASWRNWKMSLTIVTIKNIPELWRLIKLCNRKRNNDQFYKSTLSDCYNKKADREMVDFNIMTMIF